MPDNQITHISSSPTPALLGMPQTGCTSDCCPQALCDNDNDCDSFSGGDVNPACYRDRRSPFCRNQPWDEFFKIIKLFLEIIKKLLERRGGCYPKKNDNDDSNPFSLAGMKEKYNR